MGAGLSSLQTTEGGISNPNPMPGGMDATSGTPCLPDGQTPSQSVPSLSAINELPLEVLGQIIEAAIAPGCLTPELQANFFHLCLVCRTWRAAALAHHSLWSSLAVKTRFTPAMYDKVQAWFSRAGTAPKSLIVLCSYHQSCWDAQDNLRCDLSAPELRRQLLEGAQLDHLTLSCPNSRCLLILTKHLSLQASTTGGRSPWQALRSLRLVVNRQWETDSRPYEAVDAVFRRLPPVRSLHIHVPGYKTHYHPTHPRASSRRLVIPPPSLARLTRLTLSCDWHHRVLANTIRPCVNLKVLTLHLKSSTLGYSGHEFADYLDPEEEPITLPRLTVLRLRQASPTALQILPHFTTPLLAELDISFAVAGFAWRTTGRSEGDHWEGYLGAYINKSACEPTLQKLRLHKVTVSSWMLEQLLPSYFPCLRELTLDCVEFEDRDVASELQRLVMPGEVLEALVPDLRVINLYEVRMPSGYLADEDVEELGARHATVCLNHLSRERGEPPQLEEDDSDWGSGDEVDSWGDSNMDVRESEVHTLEHDYL